MKKVLVMEKSLEDAIAISFNAIEKNDFKKVIKLLEYVKKYKHNYDEVMINYALLISYMNNQNTSEAIRIITELDQMDIQNVQIAEVLKNIKKDLKLNKAKRGDLSYDEIISNLEVQPKLKILKDLYDKYGEDTIWSNIINPEEIDALRHRYKIYLQQAERWNKLIVNFEGFNEDIAPVDMFEFMKSIENDYFFWFNFDGSELAIILNNKLIPNYAKNFIMERIAFYTKERVLPILNIRIPEIDDEITTMDLPVYTAEAEAIIKKITTIYELDTDHDEDTIKAMIKSVLDIVIVSNYPLNSLENQEKSAAIVAFIVNDIFMGREYDVLVTEKLDFEFKDLKNEIKQYERIITFLIT